MDLRLLPHRGPTAKGWISYCHTACGDRRFRLGIHPGQRKYRCLNCGAFGCADDLGVDVAKIPRFVRAPRASGSPAGAEDLYRIVSASGPIRRLEEKTVAYLARRGITRERAHLLGIGYGLSRPWFDCAIHPWFDDHGNLGGFQARKTWHVEKPEAKVITHVVRSSPFQGALYLAEHVREGEPVVVCEGPYDALSAQRVMPAVALMGSVAYPAQVRRLVARRPSSVICALDPDTFAAKEREKAPAMLTLVRTLLKSFRPGVVKMVRYPATWEGDLGGDKKNRPHKADVIHALLDAAEVVPWGT